MGEKTAWIWSGNQGGFRAVKEFKLVAFGP